MLMNNNPKYPVLLIDDEENFLRMAKLLLKSHRISNVMTCSDTLKAMELIKKEKFSVILLDIIMPNHSGEEILCEIMSHQPDTPVIMVTAVNEISTVVNCMKIGAMDYVTKPIEEVRFIISVENAIMKHVQSREDTMLKEAVMNGVTQVHSNSFDQIITNDVKMHGIFKYIEAVADSPHGVLLTGETGVGKELFAKAIHDESQRKGEFVAVNLAGLDSNMFSDTLFGHVKGAYTGACDERMGLIEKALNGTLFLDEIGDLELENQVKLLRLLQEKMYYQIGSDKPKYTDVKIISATNKNIEELQEKNIFRSDLYYRLKTHEIKIPALRERKNDIPLLVNYFIEKFNQAMNKKISKIPKELYTLLNSYHFPGNVRELEGLIVDAVSSSRSNTLPLSTFKQVICKNLCEDQDGSIASKDDSGRPLWFAKEPFLPGFKSIEKALIDEALFRSKGNVSQAAGLLGITRQALNNRISRNKIKKL